MRETTRLENEEQEKQRNKVLKEQRMMQEREINQLRETMRLEKEEHETVG